MRCKEKLESYLREQQVPFQVQHHPVAYTAREVAASEHLPPDLMAKVVVAFLEGKPAVLVVPASHQVALGRLPADLGGATGTARLAVEDELTTLFPDCEVGAMPPFGNLYDLPVYVDEALTEHENLVFQAGTHTDTMSMRYADFARLVKPKVAKIAYRRGALTAA
jgi:Ala-tRNA(Pro) deacylase